MIKIKLFLFFGLLFLVGVVTAVDPTWNSSAYTVTHNFNEDTVYFYNFTTNLTIDSVASSLSVLDMSWENGSLGADHSSYYFLPWNDTLFSNSTTGIMKVNASTDNETGNFTLNLFAQGISTGQSAFFNFYIFPINDKPSFNGITNKSFNMSELFEYVVNITDEEDDVPFNFTFNFTSCGVAEWSTRDCDTADGRELFNGSHYNFNETTGKLNFSFIPTRNDVGSYIINVSITDDNILGNETISTLVNWTVLNVNAFPYFRYVCDNERSASEDTEFTCEINISDIDETNNLTISINYTWFLFNNSGTNDITVVVNSSTNYNASVLINFTANDSQVGNWSVNISITDTGGLEGPIKINETLIFFYINNTEDDPRLERIVDQNATGSLSVFENRTFYINGTDNDLFVPDKAVKNETLSFASNTSWVNVTFHVTPADQNYTSMRVDIDWDTAIVSPGVGNYTILINVTDINGTYDDDNFTIEILSDSPPLWDNDMQLIFEINEDSNLYLNLTKNVTDADDDAITFSYTNTSQFPNFTINTETGIIDITPSDEDVGEHILIINATDGKISNLSTFNFTVYNVDDNPFIEDPITITNGTTDNPTKNVNLTEENVTTIEIWVQDDDYRIPSGQKNFFNESIQLTLNITGVNDTLFNFTKDSAFPTESGTNGNRSHFTTTFAPFKADIGPYNITINASDYSNSTVIIEFNLTILSIVHNPTIASITNKTSRINGTFYLDVNTTDEEDGNDSSLNFTYNITFLSGDDFILSNESIFNTTSGVLNFTFNDTDGGKYHLNISVNDTDDLYHDVQFWLHVYDIPTIHIPNSTYVFEFAENTTTTITYQVNHSVLDDIIYETWINDVVYNGSDYNFAIQSLRQNVSSFGNGSNVTWVITPNFTEEDYSLVKNLTLISYYVDYRDLNVTQTWNVTVNHTNDAVNFTGPSLGSYQATTSQEIEINLSTIFSDLDYNDQYYLQEINFTVISNSSPTYVFGSVTNWTMTLTSTAPTNLIPNIEILKINATDIDNSTNLSLTSAISNTFEVKFTNPTTETVNTPSSGGGGNTPVAFKIIAPGNIAAFANQEIEIPLKLQNRGRKSFRDITLIAAGFKNSSEFNLLRTEFDIDSIESLRVGEEIDITLTAIFETEALGEYEIIINATSVSPKYTDWARIFVSLQEINESEVRRIMIFTEEFIVQNPECVEITEVLDEAKALLELGQFSSAKLKADEAISACKDAIAQISIADVRDKLEFELNEYLVAATFASFIVGISYYYIKRRRFKNQSSFDGL